MTPAPVEARPYHHGDLRSALLDAAERALRERGAGGISLRDLARGIGVSHGAPHRHFVDRQQLLDALAEAGFARLCATIRQALPDVDRDYPDRVRSAVGAFAHFATENAALLELMHAGKRRAGATPVAAASEAAYRPVVELIEEGQRRGALGAGDPERIGLILFATAQGITTMVNGGLVDARLLDELVETAVRQFLRGAAPGG